MPLLTASSYTPPVLFRNRHVQTLYPALFRTVATTPYLRERISLPDGDFIDLDWARCGGNRLVVLLHGLEGNASRHYIKGMAKAFNADGWDAVAINFRGCSGSPNRLPRSYHAGATEDLETVLAHALHDGRYVEAGLIGFSLGGNVVLKYLGERGDDVPGALVGAVTFSVPCDLASSSEQIARPQNRLYMVNFLKSLRAKMEEKASRFPDSIRLEGIERIADFRDFDGAYTAPLHGFDSAEAYWSACSSSKFLANICIPTLLVNAADDPFLGPECYPVGAARRHEYLILEIPDHGGHVGFMQFNRANLYWSEQRAHSFLTAQVATPDKNGVAPSFFQ